MAKVPTTTCIWSTIWGPKPRGLEGMCFWSISSRNAWSCQVTATMTISCSPPRLGFRKAYQGTTSTQKFKPCANNAARFFFWLLLCPFSGTHIYHSNLVRFIIKSLNRILSFSGTLLLKSCQTNQWVLLLYANPDLHQKIWLFPWEYLQEAYHTTSSKHQFLQTIKSTTKSRYSF